MLKRVTRQKTCREQFVFIKPNLASLKEREMGRRGGRGGQKPHNSRLEVAAYQLIEDQLTPFITNPDR